MLKTVLLLLVLAISASAFPKMIVEVPGLSVGDRVYVSRIRIPTLLKDYDVLKGLWLYNKTARYLFPIPKRIGPELTEQEKLQRGAIKMIRAEVGQLMRVDRFTTVCKAKPIDECLLMKKNLFDTNIRFITLDSNGQILYYVGFDGKRYNPTVDDDSDLIEFNQKVQVSLRDPLCNVLFSDVLNYITVTNPDQFCAEDGPQEPLIQITAGWELRCYSESELKQMIIFGITPQQRIDDYWKRYVCGDFANRSIP